MATSRQRTILVAEDDAALLALLSEILEAQGYRVLEAADGVRLIRLIAEDSVDAVLLDVRLGADDGLLLARELRLDRPELPIALMSGDSTVPETSIGPFLAKPFTAERVRATVEALLR